MEHDREHRAAQTRLRCPYCANSSVTIEMPSEKEGITEKDPVPEIEALPYARDIGKFDGPDGEPRGEWSWIGQDFFRFLGWERIGILHVEPDTRICYCVARCRSCARPFDVFANYTRGRKLAQIWPHLLGTAAPGAREVKLYQITSPLFRMTLSAPFAWSFPLLLFLASFLYDLLAGASQLGARGALAFLITQRPGDVVIRGGITIVVTIMLLLRRKYIELFRNEAEFDALLDIRERRGKLYWQNFALCRFYGFQRPGAWFSPNQVMVYGGCFLVLVLSILWLRALPEHAQRLATPGAVAGISLAADALFWAWSAYFVGVGAWITAVIPSYILKGLRKLPLHLDPLDDFKNAVFLEGIGLYSFLGFLTIILCVILLALVTLLTPLAPRYQWLTLWAQLGLIYLQVIIAVTSGSKRIRVLVALTLIYSVLRFFFDHEFGVALASLISVALNTSGSNATLLYQYAQLALLIVLAATTFNIQSDLTFSLFRNIKDVYRTGKMTFYQAIINHVEAELQRVTDSPRGLDAITTAQGQSLLNALDTTSNIYRKVSSAQVEPLLYRRIANVINVSVPIILALVPIVLDLWTPVTTLP